MYRGNEAAIIFGTAKIKEILQSMDLILKTKNVQWIFGKQFQTKCSIRLLIVLRQRNIFDERDRNVKPTISKVEMSEETNQ